MTQPNEAFAKKFDDIWIDIRDPFLKKIAESKKIKPITNITPEEIIENIRSKARKNTQKSTVKNFGKRAANLLFEIIYNATINSFSKNEIYISKKEIREIFIASLEKNLSKKTY